MVAGRGMKRELIFAIIQRVPVGIYLSAGMYDQVAPRSVGFCCSTATEMTFPRIFNASLPPPHVLRVHVRVYSLARTHAWLRHGIVFDRAPHSLEKYTRFLVINISMFTSSRKRIHRIVQSIETENVFNNFFSLRTNFFND